MPEAPQNQLGVPDLSYVRPLLYGIRSSSLAPELLVELPAQLAITLQQRIGSLRCAFLSPIDYARHGGDYLIVPGVAASSSSRSETIQLFINQNVRNIRTIAVDIRVTSEIVLAKIILAEKFPNEDGDDSALQFIPMLPDRDEMLRKADAALIVNFHPQHHTQGEPFALDLVDEWNDLTGLPYVHGLWVCHEDQADAAIAQALSRARDAGVAHLTENAEVLSAEKKIPRELIRNYLASFSYSLGEQELAGLSEFIRYAFFHGVIRDIPELNFLEDTLPPPESIN
ncbi:MAG TPA: MqnA/MqnD/SBP family protein [Bacteroidota bacterium]|nr:MqnA/MqnD/SBP family protein [Bacteroidota bacterium]